jgi:hypothetical protein
MTPVLAAVQRDFGVASVDFPAEPRQITPTLYAPPASPPEFEWSGINITFSVIWVLLILDSFSKCGASCSAYAEAPQQETLEKNALLKGALFGGTVCNSIHWADTVGMISIGEAAAFAKTLGYGATAIISLFGTADSIQQLAQIEGDDDQARRERILAFLTLGYRVTTLAWSVLGIASFIAGATLLPAVTAMLFLASFIFFMAEIVYKARIARQEEHAAANPQPV